MAEEEDAGREALTAAQKVQMEENRKKALTIKKVRRNQKSETKFVVDSGAGFFLEDDDNDEVKKKITEFPAPIIKPDRPSCVECSQKLADSYLLRHFDVSVCDECRNTEKDGKHELITKTDAKKTFLLRDADFDRREPPLKFIIRRNPHNERWGEMKLYLRSQVEERALEVWGSEEALEKELIIKEGRKEQFKKKRYNRQIKELRIKVRSSMFNKKFDVHKHQFGKEIYDHEADEYSKTCLECGYTHIYEKM